MTCFVRVHGVCVYKVNRTNWMDGNPRCVEIAAVEQRVALKKKIIGADDGDQLEIATADCGPRQEERFEIV